MQAIIGCATVLVVIVLIIVLVLVNVLLPMQPRSCRCIDRPCDGVGLA